MIRSLTVGLPLGAASPATLQRQLEEVVASSGHLFREAAVECRTTRLTLPACGPEFEMEGSLAARVSLADRLADSVDARWICLPLDYVAAGATGVRSAAAAALLKKHRRLFVNYIVADGGTVAVGAAHAVGKDILRISRLANNGFDNFRVGASFNCPPNAPFFPFSRHHGPDMAFSLALEAVPLAAAAANDHPGDLGAVAQDFSSRLAEELVDLEEVGRRMQQATGAQYRGIDASLAPLPGRDSVAAVVGGMLGCPVGGHGTLLATAMLTDSIRSAFAKSGASAVGFNGVMYSVLEDDGLAASVSDRHVSLDALLSYASVCGCGIDMVPITGSAFPEEIAACLLDVAGLSVALGKPLGFRVLPIPGKGPGEFTEFNQDFLCDSRVLPLDSAHHRTSAASPTVRVDTTVGALRGPGSWK